MPSEAASTAIPRWTVSAAVCTWNGERWLGEQIQSILEQSRPVDEIVVFDDGSGDSTPSIVDRIAQGSSIPIRFHVNESNLGSTRNFQEVIRACRGDVVFLSDQDDRWMPDKVAEILDCLSASPGWRWVFTDGELMDEEGRPLSGTLWGKYGVGARHLRDFGMDPLGTLLRRPIVTGATFAAFREDLLGSLPVPSDWVHDHWLTLHLAARGIPGTALPKALVRYRVHASQQIGVKLTGLRKLAAKSAKVRGEDYLREVRRLEDLRESLRLCGTPSKGIAAVDDKIRHFLSRARLHQVGTLRGMCIAVSEFAHGRYKHSWSNTAFVLDLLRAMLPNRRKASP